ncbi:hypothetical protein CYMTET_42735 [Cymbomonas tetramitiformis]|uniref:procollagen-proline 4-dioxygenase n=1 Tax=Cymbomonas tetramitiformis TaxID=36881 RepID=A0AAE0F0Y3_9CHLO|nr:hypothetical protein CYMTET_42735 [Cymbomonas tetramitiformis]|eukprot:gene10022-11862_t
MPPTEATTNNGRNLRGTFNWFSSGTQSLEDSTEERLIGWKGETHHVRTKEEPHEKMFRETQEGRARGAWIEQLSWRPRAYLYHNFLSDEECDHIISLSEKRVQRSSVVDSVTGKVKEDPIRTSHQTFLRRAQDPIMAGLEERLGRFSGIPAENGEDMQVLRYQHGQKYDAHHDVGELNTKSGQELASIGGYRMATALLYLTTVEEGGETVFPFSEWIDDEREEESQGFSECGKRGVAAKPKKGDMLMFWSITLKHTIDPASMHAGCPVLRGEKWTATKWMHEKPFKLNDMFSRSLAPKLGHCEDKEASCAEWAKMGECLNNSPFMLGQGGVEGMCRKSCKAC